MARFAAPPRQSERRGGNVTRNRHGGLGGQPEPIASGDDAATYEIEHTTPSEGFAGILSRTRFTAPVGQIVVGHGSRQAMARTQAGSAPGADPADQLSRFDGSAYHFRAAQSELPGRAEFMTTLDTLSLRLVALRVLRYFRHRIDSTVPGFQLQDPNAMGWGKGPFPRAIREPRFTLRPEYMQGAQSFRGEHTLVVKGGKSSTSPVRMGPARTNRLTRRASPGSFGQRAEVMA
jgi:hypothetical protein